MSAWKLTGHADKASVAAALDRHGEMEDWPPDTPVSGHEIAEDRPDEWVIEMYLPRKPTDRDMDALRDLFDGEAPTLAAENLPDTDWVTESQKGVDPIREGRFHVHTPDHEPDPERVNFVIPASQAFGTGQHETTAGCLAMLDLMKREGNVFPNHADIGTGTGLLAFAAMHLWPGAYATASDIDPVCTGVLHDNAETNGVRLGVGRGRLTFTVADGVEDELIQLRGPYDLLIANILAGPLAEMAEGFAGLVTPGGSVLLAGLLETQEPAVRAAYRRAGFRLSRRLVRGDWAILWLRKRR